METEQSPKTAHRAAARLLGRSILAAADGMEQAKTEVSDAFSEANLRRVGATVLGTAKALLTLKSVDWASRPNRG